MRNVETPYDNEPMKLSDHQKIFHSAEVAIKIFSNKHVTLFPAYHVRELSQNTVKSVRSSASVFFSQPTSVKTSTRETL